MYQAFTVRVIAFLSVLESGSMKSLSGSVPSGPINTYLLNN